MDVKHRAFRAAAAVADDDAVLPTSTSAMSITEIIACVERPERGVGMHFFNPVLTMKLCEPIRGLQIDPARMDLAEAAARAMSKQTVRVEDLPDFATSRTNALIGNEAMWMVEEDIATAIKLGLNHSWGRSRWETWSVETPGSTSSSTSQMSSATSSSRRTLHRRLVAVGRHGRKARWGVHRHGAADGTP